MAEFNYDSFYARALIKRLNLGINLNKDCKFRISFLMLDSLGTSFYRERLVLIIVI